MQRHAQRVPDERGAQLAGQLPSDDPSEQASEDEGEEHRAYQHLR